MKLSHDALASLLRTRLRGILGVPTDSMINFWVRDVYDDRVVYGFGDKYYERTYSVGENAEVTFGEAVEVIIAREYVPVATASFTTSADGATVDYFGPVFRLGDYPDKKFSLTDPAKVDAMIARFNARPEPLKNDLEHKVSSFLGHSLGELRKLYRHGDQIFGDMSLPSWINKLGDAKFGEGAVQVSLQFAAGEDPEVIGNALTFDPRIEDATLVSMSKGASGPVSAPDPVIEPKPARTSRGMDVRGLFESLGKFFTGAATEVPESTPGTSASVLSFTAPPASVPAGPDVEAMRSENKRIREALVASQASAFAADAVAKSLALPAEVESLKAMFSQAALDDMATGVTFSADGSIVDGSRVTNLRALISARTPHKLTQGATLGAASFSAEPDDFLAVTDFGGEKK